MISTCGKSQQHGDKKTSKRQKLNCHVLNWEHTNDKAHFILKAEGSQNAIVCCLQFGPVERTNLFIIGIDLKFLRTAIFFGTGVSSRFVLSTQSCPGWFGCYKSSHKSKYNHTENYIKAGLVNKTNISPPMPVLIFQL